MTKCDGVEFYVHHFELDTRRRCVVRFMIRPLHPRRKGPLCYKIEGWMGPTASLEVVERR